MSSSPSVGGNNRNTSWVKTERQGWGDDLVSVWVANIGVESDPQNLCKKSQAWWQELEIPVLGRSGFLGLTGQPA